MIIVFKDKEHFKKEYINALDKNFRTTVENATTAQLYASLAMLLNKNLDEDYNNTNLLIKEKGLKKAIYFSMEFLMGRLITNNLQNSGNYQIVKEAFKDFNIDINKIEDVEEDTGLGNGGLGRLAACFLDSAASLGLPLYGNSIRYTKGFFIQEFVNNQQIEKPDPWLDKGFYWEEKIEDEAIDIPFFGYVEDTVLKEPIWIKAVPYDVKIVGNENNVVTTLRLWSTEASELQEFKDEKYYQMVNKISDSLYPDDSTYEGKKIRLQQQYLLSASGIQAAIKEHLSLGRDIRELHKYYAFQINDTHPTLIIPELMRGLMDVFKLGYDEAWEITKNACSFTNHTIMQEALEKWDIKLFRELLPRIYEIIKEMDRRFVLELEKLNVHETDIYNMKLIGTNSLRMANICIYGTHSTNGVAALHTEILKNTTFNNFYKIYPERFNNKTNGITHRRWMMHINTELVAILDKWIGKDWRYDLSKIEELLKFKEDKKLKKEIIDMKMAKKIQLAKRIKELEGIELDPNSIFDIQVKRLHEYKRQLLNIMHIIYLYLRLKKDQEFRANFHPQSFIFGAKAAPSYHMAKSIIELINTVSKVINSDFEVNDLIKVVFVENYNVTYAEYIMTAADLSEQISTASKEASGTGNMKFMLNGALTIGTLDGANVEIAELAGSENEFIFGMTAKEVLDMYEKNNYKPREIYDNDQRLIDIFEFIQTLNKNPHHFDNIKHSLLNSDYFFVLKDFDAYVKAQEIANNNYKDKDNWFEKVIVNIAKAGFFTSDRTIEQYNNDIWHLTKIK
ncbi:glycogen/starch/alpha-glucan family phosphorylase [Haploplasma modicum]|uniref:glycogen/starch/alpha-glucan family phosphorylase n=1 Tax=Haploplasma modicum TaxID=2150 RepID=UPI00047E5565|nr:glycogen/starch/alpha-glucan family phosphorylase [Haploplasma modicum]